MRSLHTGTRAWAVVALITSLNATAMATRWVGVPTAGGAVERHPTHQQVLLSQPYTQVDFENLGVGMNVAGYSLSGMIPFTDPLWAAAVVRSGLVADVPPASGSRAIEIPAVAGQGSHLIVYYDQPVQVAGFVAMNLNSLYYVSTYDADATLISRTLMPAVPAGNRQWIGIYEQGRNFFAMRIEPVSSGRYGIDNLEYSRHAPEPSTAFMLLGALSCIARRGGKKRMSFDIHHR